MLLCPDMVTQYINHNILHESNNKNNSNANHTEINSKVIMAPGYTSLTEIHCIKKYNKSNRLNIIYVA